MSCGSGGFLFFEAFGFAAPLIMLAISKFDFDSTPPVATIFPSEVKATEVTLRPIVPAVIVPSTLVIIALMSAMFGIVGIEPRLRGFGIEPRFGSGVMLAIGDEVRLRRRLPEATSQSATSPCPPTVANTRPSALNPTWRRA